jgi:DNA end-binding protein Ku
MARSLWTGSLSFGLVNVPVALHSGVVDRDIHFHLLEAKTKQRVETRRVCEQEDVEVPFEHIVHGYDVGDDTVALTDDELARLAPERTKTVDIEAFVALDEIPAEHFDHPYLLTPNGGEGAARAYRLLAGTMEDSGRVALGRFVLRSREYLVALRASDGVISLATLLFADELRDPASVGDARVTAKDKATAGAVKRTTELLEAMTTDFDPADYPDRHRARVKRLLAKKRKGGTIADAAEPETPAPTPDLMAALRASLDRVTAG